MRLQSLIHLIEVTRAAVRSERIVVLGSSSLLVHDAALGESGGPLETSFDADLLVEPCDDELAAMLDEAIGQDRKFHARFGYHADFLRPGITHQLPLGWEERLKPVPGCEGAFGIEPHDLAVAKLHAGRPKDIGLLASLLTMGVLKEETIRARLRSMVMQEKLIIHTHHALDLVVSGAGKNLPRGAPGFLP